MKKFVLIFLLLSCCSYNQNLNINNLSDIDFSTKLSLKEFKINLEKYANDSPYPNIEN